MKQNTIEIIGNVAPEIPLGSALKIAEALSGRAEVVEEAPAKPAAKTSTNKSRKKSSATKPIEIAEEVIAEEPEEVEEATTEQPTLADLRAAMMPLIKDAAKKPLLAEYLEKNKWSTVAQIPEDQFVNAIEFANSL